MAKPMTSYDRQGSVPLILIIAGPSATGKTTVAQAIAQRYGFPFVEGDELHPKANVEKMASGHPLTDEDRWDWLRSLCKTVVASATAPESSPSLSSSSSISYNAPVCVASCSALKRTYRDFIRKELGSLHATAPKGRSGTNLQFIYLTASEEELLQRINHRKGHYMKSDMVHSQVESSEVPNDKDNDDGNGNEAEQGDFVVISTDGIGSEEVSQRAISAVERIVMMMMEKSNIE